MPRLQNIRIPKHESHPTVPVVELYALQKRDAALFSVVLITCYTTKGTFGCVSLANLTRSPADVAHNDNMPKSSLVRRLLPGKLYGRGCCIFCVFRFRDAQQEFETTAGLLDVLDWRRRASLEHARVAERKFNYHQSQEVTVHSCGCGRTR